MTRDRLLLLVALTLSPSVALSQGNPVGPEFRVNTYTSGGQRFPSVAASAVGDFVVVWADAYQDGFGTGIFGQRYSSAGAPLGPEFRVNTTTADNQDRPAVSADAAGNFFVVWDSFNQDGSAHGVFGQRFANSGLPLGPEFRVNTYTSNVQAVPSVSMASTGGFVVVWLSSGQDGSGVGVFGQRYAASGAPLGTEFRVNVYTTGDQGSETVASDSVGNFIVVWASQFQEGDLGVFARRYDSGGVPLGAEFRVNTVTTGQQNFPSVALGRPPASNFAVTWQSPNQDGGFTWGVFAQRYSPAGVPVGPEFRVNTFTTGHQEVPAAAADSAGNFVVVWSSEDQDGWFDGVFGQRYSSSGTQLGQEFRVNTYTTYRQITPSVAADDLGNFVVVWVSLGQDGSSYGIYGQRYSQIVPVELTHVSVE